MLDIKRIQKDPGELIAAMKNRNEQVDVQAILTLDEARRDVISQVEIMKNRRNEASAQVARAKKEGKDTAAIQEEMKQLGQEIKNLDDRLREMDEQLNNQLLSIPNYPHASVPVGADESANVETKRCGTPPTFAFAPKAHWDIGEELGILDFPTAAKVTGARFVFYKGAGARLERAVLNFFLNTHVDVAGYEEVFPPYMVHRRSMVGTGQLPKFEEDAFKVQDTEYFLIPTAEVPITNMHRESILDGENLPLSYVGYSANFRSEAGSAGRDTRGLIRTHQFNKVELVKFVKPEDSYAQLETLTQDACRMLDLLGLAYRISLLSTGDMGFASAKTYDLEVWMPSYDRYVEISSCSNFEDFQARRAGIRFRREKGAKPEFVHTLNGSGLAVGRTVAAILENFQQADGSVRVPEVLVPYMGMDTIKPRG